MITRLCWQMLNGVGLLGDPRIMFAMGGGGGEGKCEGELEMITSVWVGKTRLNIQMFTAEDSNKGILREHGTWSHENSITNSF